jgi:two-component system KDP operon response regulator KdpE
VLGDARLYFGEPPQSDSTIILTRKRPADRLTLDADHRCLRYGQRQIGERLAPREYDLLKILADSGGHVVERRRIEEALWGADAYDDNALHQLVRRTREKIGDDSSTPNILLTLPGVGYRLDLDAIPAGD